MERWGIIWWGFSTRARACLGWGTAPFPETPSAYLPLPHARLRTYHLGSRGSSLGERGGYRRVRPVWVGRSCPSRGWGTPVDGQWGTYAAAAQRLPKVRVRTGVGWCWNVPGRPLSGPLGHVPWEQQNVPRPDLGTPWIDGVTRRLLVHGAGVPWRNRTLTMTICCTERTAYARTYGVVCAFPGCLLAVCWQC